MVQALNPLIAVVIIVAVAVMLAVAIIGYVFGFMSITSTGSLQILPDSYVNSSDTDYTLRPVASIHLHVRATGKPIKVVEIVVRETGSSIYYFYLLDRDMSVVAAYRYTRGVVTKTITLGRDYWVVAPIPGGYGRIGAGELCHVEIYTADGEKYAIVVKSK